MNKLASPQDLAQELRGLLAYAEGKEPSRGKLASELRTLADRVSTQKTANTGYDILKSLIDYNDFLTLHHRLEKEDEQSANLMGDIFSALAKEFKISSGAERALSRMRDITSRGQHWDASLLRNNIFKAADSLGMKLPSSMF